MDFPVRFNMWNKTEADAMEIFHIEKGKIIEAWEISDRLGLMMQLGMELRPKERK